MLGISSEHVLDRPASDAYRLAASGEREVRFTRPAGDRVVEVVAADGQYVLRGTDGDEWARLVRRPALAELARHVAESGRWTVECAGDPPEWLDVPERPDS